LKACADQEDHIHTLSEGGRALRQIQQQVCKAIEALATVQQKERQKARQTGSHQGTAAVTARAERKAEAALEKGVAVENAWATIRDALRLFTPTGELNTRARAERIIAAALPVLKDAVWSRTRRALRPPQLLAYLDGTHDCLAALPVSVREAAVQAAGLKQRPEGLRGEGPGAAVLRGVLLAAGVVLALAGAEGVAAVAGVQQVLAQAWRASSLVEGLNSVVRMQQARHQRLTPGLLSLKRLYWNCRTFATGRRRGQTPYGLLGMALPTSDWWELLKLPALSQRVARAGPLPCANSPAQCNGRSVSPCGRSIEWIALRRRTHTGSGSVHQYSAETLHLEMEPKLPPEELRQQLSALEVAA
jgi:hypothetical protein